jgi:type IV pilus assembly protein PilA
MSCTRNDIEMEKRAHSKGFTLIELMIVVAILGILAAVAIAGYSAYIRKSRNSEATAILADIRLKQEAYRGTFHTYADQIYSKCEWTPEDVPGRNPVTGSPYKDGDCEGAWRQLGIRLPEGIYFQYSVEAGDPGVAPANNWYAPRGLNVANDFWYAATALQDLQEDGKCAGFVTASTNLKMVQVSEGEVGCP